ncbi:MAG: phosphatidate cytidylyltransferase [Actinomycetota bacterium]
MRPSADRFPFPAFDEAGGRWPPHQSADDSSRLAPGIEESTGQQPATRMAARSARRRPGDGQGYGKAGRNLPAAIGVSLVLAVVVVAGLFVRKEVFVAIIAVTVGVGLWELIQALAHRGLAVPVVPVFIGGVSMVVAAYAGGSQALAVCFILTAIGVMLWRTAEGGHRALPDVIAGVFAVAYLPLLASFVSLMLASDDGSRRVFTFIAVTAASDTGGYVSGVLAGRHPMAPSISPKKSWEGLLGSVAACAVVAVGCVTALLNGPWWLGVALGVTTALAATFGDLCESLIKRDLDLKDMGSFLPGHGGFLDRLDSLIVTAPMAWLLFFLVLSG